MKQTRSRHRAMLVYLSVGIAASQVGCSRFDDKKKTTAAVLHPEIDAAATVESDDGMVATDAVYASAVDSTVVKASSSSPAAGSYLTFPPGSLGVDCNVILQATADIDTTDLTSQVLDAGTTVTAKGEAIAITFQYDINAVSPFTATMIAPPGATSVAVIGWENIPNVQQSTVVLIPPSEVTVVNGFATVSLSAYGLYQAVVLSVTPTVGKQVTVAHAVQGPSTPTPTPVPLGNLPATFLVTGPTATLTDGHPQVAWAPSTGATTYNIKVDGKDPACGAPAQTLTGISGTTATVAAVDGTNYLCITANNAAGATPASNNGFKFTAAAILPPTPAQPTGDPVTDHVSTTFHWTTVASTEQPVVEYLLQVGTTVGGAEEFTGHLPPGTTFKQILGASGVTYYARVAAIDAVGNQSAWSPVSSGVLFP